jgi:uncharacterized repeat protein (TIGR01451 family)
MSTPLSILFVAAALVGTAQQVTAAYPGANGRILFHSNRASASDVYKMNSDGTNQTRITFGTRDQFASWSPDGRQLAFASARDGDFEIYTANADGTSATRRTFAFGIDFDPTWSPDGLKLLFESQRDDPMRELYEMDTDGSNVTRLTFDPAADVRAAWSPLGDKIAFVRGAFDIWIMNSDGTGQANLTNHPAQDNSPAWSPDGTKIAFSSDRSGNLEIYVMNADGSAVTQLTFNSALDAQPCWSPDGTKIAFASSRDGNNEIYVMNADGSGQTRLTFNLASDTSPDWQPIKGEADLSIAKTASATGIAVGHKLTYTQVVTNFGPADATSVRLIDKLPPSAAFESASAGCAYASNTHTVTCLVGFLADGASSSATIVVRPVQGGTIQNEAAIDDADQPDSNPSNNVTVVATTVNGPPNTPPACDKLPPQAQKPPLCP